MGPLQAVNILQGWERTSADPLGSVRKVLPLEHLPFGSGAAAEPQCDTSSTPTQWKKDTSSLSVRLFFLSIHKKYSLCWAFFCIVHEFTVQVR